MCFRTISQRVWLCQMRFFGCHTCRRANHKLSDRNIPYVNNPRERGKRYTASERRQTLVFNINLSPGSFYTRICASVVPSVLVPGSTCGYRLLTTQITVNHSLCFRESPAKLVVEFGRMVGHHDT